MKWRVLLRGLLLILSLILLGFTFEYLQLNRLFSETWIDTEVRGQGWHGELLFVAMGALFTAVGLPRQMASFLAGYAFGLTTGTLLGVLASLLGCMLTFYYARLLGRGLVTARYGDRLRRLDDFMHDHTFNMTLLIRLLPAGSNLVTNLVAGVTRVRPLPFFTGSALGYIPQTLVFALIGSGISVDPASRILLGTLLFILSGVLGAYLYRKHRHGKSLGADIEAELETEDDGSEPRSGA